MNFLLKMIKIVSSQFININEGEQNEQRNVLVRASKFIVSD